jgi:carboxypeptidase C (cathepsin A)
MAWAGIWKERIISFFDENEADVKYVYRNMLQIFLFLISENRSLYLGESFSSNRIPLLILALRTESYRMSDQPGART